MNNRKTIHNIFITKYIVIILFIFSICSCQEQPKSTKKVELKKGAKEKLVQQQREKQMLLESVCLYCHKINSKDDEKLIAPNMSEVVDIYKSKYPDKENFIKIITDFTINPEDQQHLLEDAVQRYGKMPNSGIVEEDAKIIASYLFDYNF